MAEQFPKEVDIVMYCEEPQPTDVDNRIKCINLNKVEPELFNFKNRYKNDPVANGKMQQIAGGVRRSSHLEGLDKDKDSFLWDAVRFSNKVFCIVNAVRSSEDYDYVLWIDGGYLDVDVVRRRHQRIRCVQNKVKVLILLLHDAYFVADADQIHWKW